MLNRPIDELRPLKIEKPRAPRAQSDSRASEFKSIPVKRPDAGQLASLRSAVVQALKAKSAAD